MRSVSHVLILAVILGTPHSSAGQNFERVMEGVSAMASTPAISTSFVDFNQDGLLDLFVNTGNSLVSELYRNAGDGSFARVYGDPLVTVPINAGRDTWYDLDEDGDLDVVIASLYGLNVAFANDGAGGFSVFDAGDLTSTWSKYRHLGPGDFDGDGHMDFLAATRFGNTPLGFRYVGSGQYQSIDVPPLTRDVVEAYCVEWVDADADGDLDVMLCGDNISRPEVALVYRNDGSGSFQQMPQTALSHISGVPGVYCWGDFDRDGDLDPIVRNGLTFFRQLRNDGDWDFQLVSSWVGPAATSCTPVDIENDGDLDVFMTTVAGNTNRLFLNDGFGTLTEAASDPIAEYMGYSSQSTWGDMDRDGDLDAFVSTTAWEPGLLYRNLASGNHWLHLSLRDAANSPSPIGARAEVVHKLTGQQVRQVRDVVSSVFRGSGHYELAFGLGDATMIDSLIVDWPSGMRSSYSDVSADRLLVIRERAVQVLHAVDNPVRSGQRVVIEIELLGDLTDLTAVSVFHRTAGGTTYTEIPAVEHDRGRYQVSLDATEENIEYYISARFQGESYLEGQPDDPLRIRVLGTRPVIESVVDVPNDEGGRVLVSWWASALDTVDADLAFYSVWRRISGGGDAWEWLADQPTLRLERYSFAAGTLFDRTEDSEAWHDFMVVAHTSDPDVYYPSEPMSGYSIRNTSGVGAETEPFPQEFRLGANYPNPFNPITTISFDLPGQVDVELAVLDLLGRRVRILESGTMAAGRHEVTFDASGLPSGMYLYSLIAGSYSETRTMVLLR